MNKRAVLITGALVAGATLVRLLVAAVTLAAPLVPDADLSQADASFLGEDASVRSGYSVAATGDVDGDGYDDFLVGAPYDREGGAEAGQTYLILGQANGWHTDTVLSQADGSFLGESAGDQSGCSVAGAGDVNGDGYYDFLVGARAYDASATVTDTGKAYLILGQAGGWSMDTDLSQVDASLFGEGEGDQAGHSVAGVGDVDGDGYDDFLIGAPHNGEAGADAGQTYLILGRPTVSWTAGMSLTADADASFLGESGGDQSGYSVAGIGDVNGDEYDDLLIGAPYHGGGDAGKAYLILGRPTISWTVDMSLTVDADASFLGVNGEDLGGYSVAGAGDVNGDGYDDFLIGAWRNDPIGRSNAGQTYLILGRAASDWGIDFDLSSADASFWGETDSNWSGWSVAGAGDVNSDGYDDFLIGAYGNDDGGNIAGQSYLVLGRAAADWGVDFDLSSADASFWGEDEYDYAGYSVSGAGDVNGDGYDDFIVGAMSDEEGGSQAGQTYLILGNGLDLSKTAPADSLTPGETLTYTLSYTNAMYTTASNVSITDRVPANTIYAGCIGGLSCDESSGVVTWNIGDVVSQTGDVVTLTVHVSSDLCEDTIIANVAHLSASSIHNHIAAAATNTVFVTPTASFNSNTPVCLGMPISFADTGRCAAAWLWDFGDGTGSSNVQNPAYTYTGAGDYTVTLTATNASGHSDTYQTVVTVNPVPTAGFTSNSPACVGEGVVFTNASSGATSYEWGFGDGEGSVEINPVHEYVDVGIYTVVLTATNASGCRDVFSDTVTVSGWPTAGFTSSSPVCVGEGMVFTNASSGATLYEWGFGDGQGSVEINPVHEYVDAGAYMVVLTATNASGCRDVFSDTMMVNAAPTAGFTSNSPISLGQMAIFTNTSVGANIYLWDFGDGIGMSSAESPVYSYTDRDIYMATLTATNVHGCNNVYQAPFSVGYINVYLPLVARDYASLAAGGVGQ